ncbi:uncharacterized protein LOC144095554 [Amblyomma americanum]
MALDIKGAFDNVSNGAIMEGLNKTNCEKRVHNYVWAFFSKRTATVGLGDLRCDTFDTNKGTPQGSVISPILFNIAMIGLAQKLNEIEGIQHAMYADDFTVGVHAGSPEEDAPAFIEEVVLSNGARSSSVTDIRDVLTRQVPQLFTSIGSSGRATPRERQPKLFRYVCQTFRSLTATLPGVNVFDTPASCVCELLAIEEATDEQLERSRQVRWRDFTSSALPPDTRDFGWQRGWQVLPSGDRIAGWGSHPLHDVSNVA